MSDVFVPWLAYDINSKLTLTKAYIPLLGMEPTALLQYLCSAFEYGEGVEFKGGKPWCKQSLDTLLYQTALTQEGYKKAKAVLVEEQLIQIRHSKTPEAPVYWCVNFAKLQRLSSFAEGLRLVRGPKGREVYLTSWHQWCKENPDIIKEFRHLWPRLKDVLPEEEQPKRTPKPIDTLPPKPERYLSEEREAAIAEKHKLPNSFDVMEELQAEARGEEVPGEYMPEPTIPPSIRQELRYCLANRYGYDPADGPEDPDEIFGPLEGAETFSGNPVEHFSMQKKLQELSREHAPVRKEPSRDKYVEYWNSLPNTPKCKLGSKAYEFAKRFFRAHRKYEAGNCKGFMLTKDVQEEIGLDEINEVPPDAIRVGKDQYPVRSDKEMKEHLRQAALAYDPKYAPINKNTLGNLRNFLYRDGRFNIGGTLSLFLRFIHEAPKPIEKDSIKTIMDTVDQRELDAMWMIRKLYNTANGLPETKSVSLKETKQILFAARRILEKYDDMYLKGTHHFPSYDRLLDWYEDFCRENLWDGMPIAAFAPGNDMWRRFVRMTSKDLGIDIMTGERIYAHY